MLQNEFGHNLGLLGLRRLLAGLNHLVLVRDYNGIPDRLLHRKLAE